METSTCICTRSCSRYLDSALDNIGQHAVAIRPSLLRTLPCQMDTPSHQQSESYRVFFVMTTRHRTVDLFEGRVACTMWELKKLYNKRLGFHKPVSKRKSRISNTEDLACNPHLATMSSSCRAWKVFDNLQLFDLTKSS